MSICLPRCWSLFSTPFLPHPPPGVPSANYISTNSLDVPQWQEEALYLWWVGAGGQGGVTRGPALALGLQAGLWTIAGLSCTRLLENSEAELMCGGVRIRCNLWIEAMECLYQGMKCSQPFPTYPVQQKVNSGPIGAFISIRNENRRRALVVFSRSVWG